MKPAFSLSTIAAVAPLLASATSLAPRNGLKCQTVWYGALTIVERDTPSNIITYLALGDDTEKSLVFDEGSGEYRAQFTFSRCNVGTLSENEGVDGYSYGVLQPGTQSTYDAMFGCITATSGQMQRLTVGECASFTGDTILPQQWFKVQTNGVGGGGVATVELQGNTDGAYYGPNAGSVSWGDQTAITVGQGNTGKVLAFAEVHKF